METFLHNDFHAIKDKRVGNQVPRYSGWKLGGKIHQFDGASSLETKYRDIADGNGLP